MKSKLSIVVTLFGWVLLIAYIFYDYAEHGSTIGLKRHLLTSELSEVIFHLLVLSAPIGSTITGYLISERKKLLQKTRQSERELEHAAREWEAIFDAVPYGLMLLDRNFNILMANEYISNFSGMPIKELIFKKCYEIVHKQDRPIDGCPLVKTMETKHIGACEHYEAHVNRYFMTSVTPIFDDENTTVAYVHLLIDITDIKQKEKKLTQSRDAFFNMLRDLNFTYKELEGLYHNLIIAFSVAIDAKSPWTKGHSERVTNYAISIAKEMGVSDKDIDALRTACLLHDIGKIGTYDVLLNKPDKLTHDEFALIKKHTIVGENILKPIKELEHILPIIRSHHEKVDGTGYPDGLKSDEISLLAKILCVADAFDSMTSDRPYRPAPGKEFAISELKRCSGTHFDPQVVEAFLKVLERKGKTMEVQPR